MSIATFILAFYLIVAIPAYIILRIHDAHEHPALHKYKHW